MHPRQMRDTRRSEFPSFAYSILSLFFEYQFHRLRVERLHLGQFQVFHHVERALLVLLEVVGLQVLLIGFLGGIDFEDADLCRVLGTLHRVEADNTRLSFYTQTVHLVGKFEILLEVLRIDLDFSQADYHRLVFLC